METFRVGLTRDFLKPDGTIAFGDIGLDVLDGAPNVEWEFMPSSSDPLRPDEVSGYDALLVLAPRVTEATLDGAGRLRIVARFGVGYDNVDVDACTRAGVLLTITPGGVRRPVAAAAMAFILGLAHGVVDKDRITRAGRWDARMEYIGVGLTGRTLGIVGLGNIGREIARLARPFDLRLIGADPFLDPGWQSDDVEVVALDELLHVADFVRLAVPLTEQTRHMIGDQQFETMKPSAFLINVARGPIVDEVALVKALTTGSIRGAALDVFEVEPVSMDNPLVELDNVILAPHSIAWTDEIFRGNGSEAFKSIVALSGHVAPTGIVNRDVLSHPRVQEWLRTPGRAAT